MTNDPSQSKLGPKRRWVWILLSLGVLVGVVLVLFDTEDTIDVVKKDALPPAPIISVQRVVAQEIDATISAYAELRPRWDADIRAAVSGRILTVHDTALAGSRIEQGAPLFSLEKTRYKTGVAAAELNLEDASLGLLQARNKMAVAQRQFERDGVEPPTELAIHLPQVRVAERTMISAKARLQAALEELGNTEIKAPFSGFITQRSASLGQTVSVGDALVHLSDDRQFELVVELSQSDWALLAHPIAGKTAQLFDRKGQPLGEAHIRRGGGFLDKGTRQMRVFLEVSSAHDGLLAGDFVKVSFAGRKISQTLTLREAALTRSGHIWLVGKDDLLHRIIPEIYFRTDDRLTIALPAGYEDDTGQWTVAVTPLASFLPGQRVSPQVVKD